MRKLNPFPSILPNDSPNFPWFTKLLKKQAFSNSLFDYGTSENKQYKFAFQR